MNDFEGLLSSTDYGFKPQGKSAPMSSSRSASSSSRSNADPIFNSRRTNQSSLDEFGDVFGGPPTTTTSSSARREDLGFNFDYMSANSSVKSSSAPVFDKPVYDEDVGTFDNVFASVKSDAGAAAFDDLLDNLGGGGGMKKEKMSFRKGADDFDDLIPGFGRSSSPPSSGRQTSDINWSQKSTDNATKTRSSLVEDPFVVLESSSPPKVPFSGISTDPLEEISKFNKPGSTRTDGSSRKGGVFDDLDPLDTLGKSFPKFSSEVNDRNKERSPSRTASGKESTDDFSAKSSGERSRKNMSSSNNQESHASTFDMPSNLNGYQRSVGPTSSPPSYEDASPSNMNSSQFGEDNFGLSDDVLLTVSEVPLYTQPTTAPPPARPPPPRPAKVPKSQAGGSYSISTRKKVDEFSSFPNSNQQYQTSKSVPASARSSVVSPIDELEDFAMGGAKANFDGYADVYSGDDVETPSDAFVSAAAMKEAMDKAEAKFRHAKELRERENAKASRSREGLHPEKEDNTQDSQERLRREKEEKLENERRQRQLEEEEREQRRARELDREIEEKEREQRRIEKERERAREIEREREKARQAVERATREARERAAAEARLKAERAAVEKVNAQARERAERAAVQRAQAEARERAAAEAKERAEKAAAEAREKAQESRLRAERAATERATAEARERSAAEARERAAAEARQRAAAEAREKAAATAAAASVKATQRKNEDDLESFFGMGSRPSSAPRARTNSSDPFDSQFQTKQTSDAARWTSVGTSSSMKKASSATNIVDDLSSIFGAAPSSFGEFQEVEGENEERRRARLERQQRTQERAAKALAEKNQRDLQVQREQAERHRIAETLDVEIKRWAAGKEGNLRALLSTMQYVLWPECGWQPVSLTDLITAAAVKKVYRKANLCIHPDKVQQKGATLQQKYIAEKVFDLLKEAWNKFNSEELF